MAAKRPGLTQVLARRATEISKCARDWFAAHLIDSLSDRCVIGGYACRPGSGTTQNSCASTLVIHSRNPNLLQAIKAKPQGKSRLLRANNSFKPSPLRGLGAGGYD